MRQANTRLKWALALFSLLLTVLIWRQGLRDSFDRPSVAPKISLIQTEMAVSASPSFPEKIQAPPEVAPWVFPLVTGSRSEVPLAWLCLGQSPLRVLASYLL